MRFTSIISVSLIAGLAFQPVIATSGIQVTPHKRATSILSNPPAQPLLPPLDEASRAAAAASLNLSNIQGDILIGMKKKVEVFLFFHINDAKAFKKSLKSLSHSITSTLQVLDNSTQPVVLINVAFSSTGLLALGMNDTLNDTIFSGGQFADAPTLNDTTAHWVEAFKSTNIHGLFIFASDTLAQVNSEVSSVKRSFGPSFRQLHTLQGQVRPGNEEGHEHFGFVDGISQPGINGFTTNPTPGQLLIDPGHILLNETGDDLCRPTWAKGGSFLAFRQLKQLVPEFDKFLTDNPIMEPGFTPQQGSELMGARMIGRWKSGAPIDLTPLFDDPVLGADPQRNNNFTFAHPNSNKTSDQSRCPFSAHIRKTAPRADFDTPNIKNHIIRSGIPYGPEVTSQEANSNTTRIERGLAFVAYQSQLANGFHFIQRSWANNPRFFLGKETPFPGPGFDPIISARLDGQPRFVHGLDPTDPNRTITLVTDFIVSRGGEYFFSPSISAISTVLST